MASEKTEPVKRDCPLCRGVGKLFEGDCGLCDGAGKVELIVLAQWHEGQALRYRRLDAGYGMREFAQRVGILPSDYCEMEHGLRAIPDSVRSQLTPPTRA